MKLVVFLGGGGYLRIKAFLFKGLLVFYGVNMAVHAYLKAKYQLQGVLFITILCGKIYCLPLEHSSSGK